MNKKKMPENCIVFRMILLIFSITCNVVEYFQHMTKFPKVFLPVLILFCLTLIIFIPAMGIKFSWVDDGWDILMCQKFINYAKSLDFKNFFNLFFETANGRFRPVYWLWLISNYLIGGNNPAIHYLLHFALIFATSFFIFKTVFLLTKSKWASFFSGALFLINPINTENWYRLGPQEPIVGFFSILSIYFLIKQKYKWLPIVFLGFAFLSKESACALLPAVIVLYLGTRLFLKKRDLTLERYSIAGLIFFGIIILVTSLTRSGYSQFYVFDPREIIHRFLVYTKISLENFEPFLGILGTTFLLRMIFFFKKADLGKIDEMTVWEIFFGFWVVFFFVVQSPWVYVMTRYMLPATIGLFVFMGIELNQLSNILKKQKIFTFFVFIFAIFLLFFLSGNLLNIINYGRRSAHGTTNVQKMTSLIAENVPKNGRVFLNFAKGEGTIELVVETGMHLELFYDRSDIKVDYFDMDNLPQTPYFVVSGTPAPFRYSEEVIEDQIKIKPSMEIKSTGEVPIITSPWNLLKQLVKKSTRFVLYKEKFDFTGIYSPYYLKDYWKFYHVKT